jgi:polysaccharide pyruvyl transferase WcaK-like protein
MRIGIVGWFGSDNLGDEILLHSLMQTIRESVADAEFLVMSPNPQHVGELHGVRTTPMPTLRGGDLARRTQDTKELIAACDLLVFGPGTIFQERSPHLRWPGTLVLLSRILALAKLVRTPVAAIGVGVREGGTAFGRSVLRSFGMASLAIGARDVRSAAYFGAKAAVIGDMAYTTRPPLRAQPTSAPRFAVSMRPLASAFQAPLVQALQRSSAALCDEGWSGEFLAMAHGRDANGEDDREIYEAAFKDRLALAGNPLTLGGDFGVNLESWQRDLAGNRLVIATRLHAALMAAALGVPTVAIAYERKVLDAFVDLGLEKFVLEPGCGADDIHGTALVAIQSTSSFAAAATRISEQAEVARGFVAATLGRLR